MKNEKIKVGEIKKQWNKIFRGKPSLTEEEAERMNETVKKFREGFEFRKVNF